MFGGCGLHVVRAQVRVRYQDLLSEDGTANLEEWVSLAKPPPAQPASAPGSTAKRRGRSSKKPPKPDAAMEDADEGVARLRPVPPREKFRWRIRRSPGDLVEVFTNDGWCARADDSARGCERLDRCVSPPPLTPPR